MRPAAATLSGGGSVQADHVRSRRGATREREILSDETLSNLSHEERRFEPPAELAANANVKAEAYDEADGGPARRSGPKQAERLDWAQKWDQVLDWDDPPFAKWFVGGTLNAAYNCVDRHVEAGLGDKVAFHWVGEPEDDTRDDHLRRAQGRGLQGRQRADRARASRPATGSRSTCR